MGLLFSTTVLIKIGFHKNIHNDKSWVYLNKIQLYNGDSVKSFYHYLWYSMFLRLTTTTSMRKRKTYLGPATKIIYQDKAALISGYIF